MALVGEKRFVCWVNPVAKIEADARAEGWDGTNGTPGDYTDILSHTSGKTFASLDEAARWGKRYVGAGKDYFGAGRIDEQVYGPDDIPELGNTWGSTHRWWEVTHDDLVECDENGAL